MRVQQCSVLLQRAALLGRQAWLPHDRYMSDFMPESQAHAGMRVQQPSRTIDKVAHPGILHHDDASVSLLRPHLCRCRPAIERYVAFHCL